MEVEGETNGMMEVEKETMEVETTYPYGRTREHDSFIDVILVDSPGDEKKLVNELVLRIESALRLNDGEFPIVTFDVATTVGDMTKGEKLGVFALSISLVLPQRNEELVTNDSKILTTFIHIEINENRVEFDDWWCENPDRLKQLRKIRSTPAWPRQATWKAIDLVIKKIYQKKGALVFDKSLFGGWVIANEISRAGGGSSGGRLHRRHFQTNIFFF